MIKLDISHLSWKLNKSFNISRGSKNTAETIEVKLTENKFTGIGECVPYGRYNETLESVQKEILELKDGIENSEINKKNLDQFINNGAARNAIDCALWDLESKKKKETVWSMLDVQKPQEIPSSYTVVLDDPDKMIEDIHGHREFPTIKIKVDNKNLDRILTNARESLPNTTIIVDANESFEVDDLNKNIDLFVKTKIDLLEQPLISTNDDKLLNINYPISICADESFHDSSDLDKISAKYDTINIKLDKTGGLTEALKIQKKAKEKGLKVMLGCMVSSSVSMMQILPLYKNADFIDLDGPCFLSEDRKNGIVYSNGMMKIGEEICWG